MSLRNLRSNAARFDNPVGSGHGAVKAFYKRIVSRRELNTFSYSPNFWFVINMTEGGFRVYNAGDTDPWTATGGAFPSTSIPPRPYMKRANAPSSPVDFGSASQCSVLALCLSDVIVLYEHAPQ
jgi:hypothetical protein